MSLSVLRRGQRPRVGSAVTQDLRRISEREWQKTVVDLARSLNWKACFFRHEGRPGRNAVAYDGKGFPDLVLVHRFTSDVIFPELKTEDGKTSPDQDAWLEWLGPRGYLWRPSQYAEVEARLKNPRTERIRAV